MNKVNIKDKIFGAYDIRGIVNEDLNPKLVENIGKAFGTYLFERGTNQALVGYDSRASSKQYEEAIIKGLISTGCNVSSVGLTLSSIIAFSRQYYNINGAVMVTASHNPPQYNGFKLYHGINAITESEIQKIKKILLLENFRRSGKGKIQKREPTNLYFSSIENKLNFNFYNNESKIVKLKIVVDAGNATPGIFIPQLIKRLGHDAIPLYCDIDPTFPNHQPDPVGIDHYKGLVKKVLEENADLGVLFDGDGDRVGFVDSKGNIWLGDTILTLLIREIIPKNPNRKVIVEIKDSEMVVEETKRLGGIPIFWKTGHALLDHKVHEENAILCGEMSCHYWITDKWYFFDDAVYAMARILQIISKGKSLYELTSELPKYENTPEYRISCPEDKKFVLVNELVQYFRKQCNKIVDIDGIRGYIYDGWFLIRASNTQPIISIRCEAKTKEGLEKIKNIIKNKIDEYSYIDLDWSRQYDVK